MHDSKSPQTVGGRFILFSIKCLVDRPEAVNLLEVPGAHTVVLELQVDKTDYRQIIGRRGRTVESLRELLLNIGGRENRRYILEIVEPTLCSDEIPGVGWLEPPLSPPDGFANGMPLPLSDGYDE
jgi:hypothetical protein